MSTFAEQIRAEALMLRHRADTLDAIAAQLDGTPAKPCSEGDLRTGRAQAVIAAVAQACAIDQEALFSRDRTDDVATARQISAYAVRTLLGFDTRTIALLLQRKCHGTVCHAIGKIRARRGVDPKFAALLNRAMAAAHAALARFEGIAA